MFDQLLERAGLTVEDLNYAERETLDNLLQQVKAHEVTVQSIERAIRGMIDGIATELAQFDLPKKKDWYLKARMKNALLLYAVLTAPDKARSMLEGKLKTFSR